jgi:integrase
MKLTEKELKKLLNKQYDKPFEVSDRDSISIRVSKKGKVVWQYRYRFNNKPIRLTLGHYPNMSLIDARDKVPELKGLLLAGKNPSLVWQNRKNQNHLEAEFTLVNLVSLWFEKVAESEFKNTTYQNYQSTIRKWVDNDPVDKSSLKVLWTKKYLNIPFDDIRNRQWMDYFDWICNEGSPVTAGSVLKLLKTIITWAIKREYIKNSSLLLFKVNDVGSTPAMGERAPTADETAKFWLEIEKSRALPQTKICLQLIILSGGRNTAIRSAKWEHFDFESNIWTIPLPKAKKQIRRTGMELEDTAIQRPELHPISSQTKELLKKLSQIYKTEGYLFPGENTSKEITIHAIDRFCSRMSSKLFKEQGISKIKPHDFRRSISSILSEMDSKWLPITEKILGHKLKGTMAHYNKADYLNEQLEAYEIYWSVIENSIHKLVK